VKLESDRGQGKAAHKGGGELSGGRGGAGVPATVEEGRRDRNGKGHGPPDDDDQAGRVGRNAQLVLEAEGLLPARGRPPAVDEAPAGCGQEQSEHQNGEGHRRVGAGHAPGPGWWGICCTHGLTASS
jgi:hypothetical protein